MTRYQKSVLVMDYLQSLGLNMLTIGRTIDNDHWEKSYKLISENPNISKKEFLEKMQIKEYQKKEPNPDQMMEFKVE